MPSENVISFSFCQVSDLNLDSAASIELQLSHSQRDQRGEEAIEALAKAMKVASRNAVDAVLIPGNLFFGQSVTRRTLARVQKIFALLGDIPVFIAAGENDPLAAESPYDSYYLAAQGLPPWSENVRIFGSGAVSSFTVKAGVRVSGFGLDENTSGSLPDIARTKDSEAIDVLLLPLTGKSVNSTEISSKLLSKIKAGEYSYAALSGFKNGMSLAEDKRIYAASAGTFVGQTEAEAGARQAIFANLDKRSAGELQLSLQREEFDPRRIVSLNIDTGKNEDTTKTALELSLKNSGARQGKDIVILRLSGIYQSGKKPVIEAASLRESYFHTLLIDRSRPDYLETLADRDSIESRFADSMATLKKKAQIEETANKEKQLTVIEDALYYGLEALKEGKVSLRDAN